MSMVGWGGGRAHPGSRRLVVAASCPDRIFVVQRAATPHAALGRRRADDVRPHRARWSFARHNLPTVPRKRPPRFIRKVQGLTRSHNIELGGHSSTQSKAANLAVKRRFAPKVSSPAARFKGLRLGDRVGHPTQNRPPWPSPSSPSAPKGESEPGGGEKTSSGRVGR